MSTNNLDQFTRGYIAAALWSSTDEEGEFLDASYDAEDIAPETLQAMIEDCQDFQQAQAEALSMYCDIRAGSVADCMNSAGIDFWLSRNGHGAGFFDRGREPVFKELQEAARVYCGVDLYIGDDGKIYA